MSDDHAAETFHRLPTHLFLVRLWQSAGKTGVEFRGRVQHVLTGEVIYFRDWTALEAFMAAQFDAPDTGHHRE